MMMVMVSMSSAATCLQLQSPQQTRGAVEGDVVFGHETVFGDDRKVPISIEDLNGDLLKCIAVLAEDIILDAIARHGLEGEKIYISECLNGDLKHHSLRGAVAPHAIGAIAFFILIRMWCVLEW